MRGAPTFWTWDRAPDDMHPRCIAPIAWRAAEVGKTLEDIAAEDGRDWMHEGAR